jgi:hypothetical protein
MSSKRPQLYAQTTLISVPLQPAQSGRHLQPLATALVRVSPADYRFSVSAGGRHRGLNEATQPAPFTVTMDLEHVSLTLV